MAAANSIETDQALDCLDALAARVAAPDLSGLDLAVRALAHRNLEEGRSPDGTPHAARKSANPTPPARLAESLAATLHSGMDAEGLTVWSDALVAAVFQHGAIIPAREIRPKNGKALVWPGAAHPVARVRHPGAIIPARPFLGVDADDLDVLAGIVLDQFSGATSTVSGS